MQPKGGGGLFNIDPGLMIWTWVVFGILFLILSKFAWKPMMESVKAREKVLADAVENAKKTKEELEKIALRQEEMLKATQEQSRQILEQGRKTADTAAKDILERAQKESNTLLERAREQIETEKQNALSEIREQAVDLVLKTSEKLILEVLDQDKHRTIVRKHLEEL
ncbi:MAG TPA: F0F1 ATP synthase subunit B [Chitinispirillaceae bacterium]|nr:F0F1 ATP synthase subunit B [Chitinispirillaceae bacterium]